MKYIPRNEYYKMIRETGQIPDDYEIADLDLSAYPLNENTKRIANINFMEEAIQKAELAKIEFNKAEQEKDCTDKNILYSLAHNHLGYAEGINQTLVCIGFKHERMTELGKLL